MALLAVFAVSFLSTTPASAATCDPTNTQAPSCISISLSKSFTASNPSATNGSCNDGTANICMDIPKGGGIVTGGHTMTAWTNSVAGYYVSYKTNVVSQSLTNPSSQDEVPPVKHPVTGWIPLGDKQWGIAIVGKEHNTENNDGLYNTTDQSVLATAKFANIPQVNSKPSSGAWVMNRGSTSAKDGDKVNIYYGVRVDNPSSLTSGNYGTTIVYTTTARPAPAATISSLTPTTAQKSDTANQTTKLTIVGSNLATAYNVYLQLPSDAGTENNKITCANVTPNADGSSLTCDLPTSGDNIQTDQAYDLYVQTQAAELGKKERAFTYTPSASICRNGDSKSDCQVDIDANMIPVKYTGNERTPQWTSLTNDEIANNQGAWYDYGKKQWANAVTVKADKLVDYQNKSAVVREEDVLGYWVYIPRYAYEVRRRDAIDEYDVGDSFDIKFETKADFKKSPHIGCSTLNGSALNYKDYNTECGIDRAYPTNKASANNTTWATHPAFTFGDKELNGIWVGKFETTGGRMAPTILPNQYHKAGEYIGVFYDIAKSVGVEDPSNVYGNSTATTQNAHHLQSATTHMLKNSEWGAVSYLSSSKYGAGVNNVQLNASKDDSTGSNDGDGKDSASITGCGPKADGDTTTYDCSGDVTHQYQSNLGQLASTTNNVYGIYDMAGGAHEYVMGNLTDTEGKGSMGSASARYFTNLPTPPYVDLYLNITGNSQCTWLTCGGDALYETANWGSDLPNFVDSSYPWFRRGGGWDLGSLSGLFYSVNGGGNNNYRYGFRVSLLAQQ